MKEVYFSLDTITDQAAEWLDVYGNSRKSESQTFDIHRAGLLILDMQRYFLESNSHAFVPSGEIIIPGLNGLVNKFREMDRPVIATRHENRTQSAGMMDAWWSELITADHVMVDIHEDLDILPGEILMKSQYDAFYKSELKKILDQNAVEQVVIGGVMTHLCCETTARSAFVQGFEVFFLIDGTATYNRDFHTSTLRNLAHGVAVLKTVDQLQAEL